MLCEAGQEQRVKDAAGPGHDHVAGLVLGVGRFVDPGMYEGVEGVRQPHHLHPGGNAVPGQPVRVAAAVPPFMVVAAHIADQRKRLALPQLWDFLQQVAALSSVGLHDGKLLLGQPAGLVEDFLRDGPFAHIMEQGQCRIKLDFRHSQRRNDSESRLPNDIWHFGLGNYPDYSCYCMDFRYQAIGSFHQRFPP